MEPKYYAEKVIGHPNHQLRIWLDAISEQTIVETLNVFEKRCFQNLMKLEVMFFLGEDIFVPLHGGLPYDRYKWGEMTQIINGLING